MFRNRLLYSGLGLSDEDTRAIIFWLTSQSKCSNHRMRNSGNGNGLGTNTLTDDITNHYILELRLYLPCESS